MIRLAALGEILRRFRFHGVPGPPAAFGVPTDRAAELESELHPIFSALRENQREVVALLAEADLEAARIRSVGTEQARQAIAASHVRAAIAREMVTSQIRNKSSEECAATLAAARSEADRIGQVTAERLPPLVVEVVHRVLVIGGTR